ncbi:MAG: hypothetical protein Q9167_000543 [Letrouitia subvulpina]
MSKNQRASRGLQELNHTGKDRISDPRFTNIQTDPRFRLPSKRKTHVEIDKRFERMLRDERFSSKAKVDRYGRALPKDAGKKDLERYYRIGKKDLEEAEVIGQKKWGRETAQQSEESLASSSSATSSDDESSSDEGPDTALGFPDHQRNGVEGIPMGQVTSRLAAVNLDWDNIQAADLFAVFSSFVTGSGRILEVSILPSEFGKRRMQREEKEGPPKEIFLPKKQNIDKEDYISESETENELNENQRDEDSAKIKPSIVKEDTGEEFDSAKLRHYQLERLRYYYAVIVCSSSSTAQSIYEAVDGTEYLTTANFFDLRFIPSDTDFSEDKPIDQCTRIPNGYRPTEFVTDALQHSKVKLTWDADDGSRKQAQKRAFTGSRADIDENDLKAYLASDSSGEENETLGTNTVDSAMNAASTGETAASVAQMPLPKASKQKNERQRLRTLLGLNAEPSSTTKGNEEAKNGPVGNIQVKFSSGLLPASTDTPTFEDPSKHEETTVEKYVRKEKERKARRKLKAEAVDTRNRESESPHAPDAEEENLSFGQSNHEEHKQYLGFDDPFFADPSTTEKKPTKSQRREAKRLQRAALEAKEAATAAERAELELLMMDDDKPTHPIQPNNNNDNSGGNPRLHHFDMSSLAKAERALTHQERGKKKNKKRKTSAREKEALEAKAKDEFQIDVQDPRFGAVFESAEYAIDPSHPRYLGTEGMRELLQQGRKKRRRREEDDGDGDGDRVRGRRNEGTKMPQGGDGGEDRKDEVQRLIEKLKGNVRK